MSESICQNTHGIHTLNHDILLHIFAFNADMFSDQNAVFVKSNAFYTTRIASHVCQNWRNLMLATPILWARLIDMDFLSNFWCIGELEELIRRSGTAPLWIRAKWTRLDPDIGEFLLCVIEENWNRIQKFVVCTQTSDFTENLSRIIFNFPAPCLETFDVAYDKNYPEDSIGPTLFGGHAPMLRSFSHGDYVVHQWEPWLHNLHSLVLDGKYDACDTLMILMATHNLQEFKIRSMKKGPDYYTLQSFPVVPLPHLKSLYFSGYPYCCTMLLDHVQIPLGCSLTVSIFRIRIYLSPEETEEQHLLAVDTFSRYARRFLQENIFQTIRVVYTSNDFISLIGEATSPVECKYCLKIGVYSESYLTELTPILNRLAELDFSKTTRLESRLHRRFKNFPPFLGIFSSVDILWVNRLSLEALIALQDYTNTTEKPYILFPLLKVVNFTIVCNYYNAALNRTADQAEIAVKFTLSRTQNGYPIGLLNMSNWPLNCQPDLDALEETQGLKVLYRISGRAGIFEHICGSGTPARRIVTV